MSFNLNARALGSRINRNLKIVTDGWTKGSDKDYYGKKTYAKTQNHVVIFFKAFHLYFQSWYPPFSGAIHTLDVLSLNIYN